MSVTVGHCGFARGGIKRHKRVLPSKIVTSCLEAKHLCRNKVSVLENKG